MDVFSEYHGQYLAHQAREVYGMITVPILSDYMRGYLERSAALEIPDPLDRLNAVTDYRLRAMPTENIVKKWVAELKSLVQEECQKYHARLPALLGDQENDNLYDTDIDLVTVICESDPGLADAEKVACMVNASKHNGVDDARRNKYKMLERLQEKGVPTVRQKLCRTESEAVTFFKEQQQRQTAKTQNE